MGRCGTHLEPPCEAAVDPAALTPSGRAQADGWRCLFGANVARFVKTPLFVLNSKFDTWQGDAIVGVTATGSIIDQPPAVQKFWLAYAAAMVRGPTILLACL